jgi:hypothetical protein
MLLFTCLITRKKQNLYYDKKHFMKGAIAIMRRNARGMMQIGAMGALAGIMLVPVLSPKTRKRITRSSRNAYFRVADFVEDIKDMATK